MLDSLRQLDGMPRSARRMRREIDAAINRVRHEQNREGTDAEIAVSLKVSADEYARMLQQLQAAGIGAVRQVDNAPGEGSFLDFAVDPEEDAHVRLERAEIAYLSRATASCQARAADPVAHYQKAHLAGVSAVIGVGNHALQLRTPGHRAPARACAKRCSTESDEQDLSQDEIDALCRRPRRRATAQADRRRRR